ncbi:MAG: tRNA (adenosine(37)-N6)-threonylcarbamoyltransferase complex dimerization subunit type 1 TsaB [Phycisphaerae bacterium]
MSELASGLNEVTGDAESAWALAMETSSAWGGVALGRGRQILEARRLAQPRRHAVEFLPTVAALCETHRVRPTDIRYAYVSTGPGSFTGLRIGVAAAKALALATGAKLVAVPSLEVIAQNALAADPPPGRVAVVLDAKRGHVYAGLFARRQDSYVACADPVETDPSHLLRRFAGERAADFAVLGEGVDYHRRTMESSGVTILPSTLYAPNVETVYRLGVRLATAGTFTDRRALVPTYVRPPEAEEKWARRQEEKRPPGPC